MEHSVFARNHNLNPAYFNQFEVDDAESKLQHMVSWKSRSGAIKAGKLISDEAYFEQKFVASHELTLSSSCLLTADSIDNVLMTSSVANYDKISSD